MANAILVADIIGFAGHFGFLNPRKIRSDKQQKFGSFSLLVHEAFSINFSIENGAVYGDILCHC